MDRSVAEELHPFRKFKLPDGGLCTWIVEPLRIQQ
jgi:hypothetical protein